MSKIEKIRFFGTEETTTTNHTNEFLKTTVKGSFKVSTHRSKTLERTLKIDNDDVIEMEFEDGFIRMMTVPQIQEEFRERIDRSRQNEEDGKEVLVLPNYINFEDQSRGFIKNFLKRIKIFSVKDKVADMAAALVAEKIESKLQRNEGIFYCNENPNVLEGPVYQLKTDVPTLLLLHGTASNTSGSFGGLMEDNNPSQSWAQLQLKYGEQIIAYEHKTLSKSPLENTVHLLEQLPEDTVLDVVSHSRGGLIGEILSRSKSNENVPFSEIEINLLKRLDRKKDVENAKRINELIVSKNITINKFVRVACPVSGTTLASKRLDDYFTVLLNIIGAIPILKVSSIYDYIKSLLIAFVKNKEDITVLPGLESMIPESPLIRILNNANVTIESELFIISGDVKAHRIFRTLAVMLSDVFFRTQHDFVVNTASMFGGSPRKKMYYAFNSNKEVSHFKYFINKTSQTYLVAALTGDISEFKILSNETKASYSEGNKVRGILNYVPVTNTFDQNKPVVYVIPGIMGSKLRANGSSIWVNPFRLAIGGISKLHHSAQDVEPYQVMGSAYKSLLKELRKSYNIIPFPFDWRNSIIDAARLLAKDIEERLATTSQPIRLMAHSMGGLVVHAFNSLPEYKNIWKRMMSRHKSRVIFLGSPLKGSHMIPSVFMKKNRNFKILHYLDLVNSAKDVLEIIKNYQGLLELLPIDAEHDYFDEKIWKQLQKTEKDFVTPLKTKLSKAKKVYEYFKNDPIQGENIIYIAGKDRYTPFKLDVTGARAKIFGTPNGDGSVTWETGIPETLKNNTWYMDVTHGKMCDSKAHFPALLELLENGTTNLLSRDRIVYRSTNEIIEMPEETPLAINNEEAIERAIMGIDNFPDVKEHHLTITVEITHGDLGNANFPVMVGHHLNDPIVSAESVVDYYMNGRLSKSRQLEIYPGELDSSLVFFNESSSHFEGAIVVGLGEYGILSENNLTKTITSAMLNFAVKNAYRSRCRVDYSNVTGISTLLVGSDYSGLNIKNSIRAILKGVNLANKKILAMNDPGLKIIDHIEFIEIYLDRAIRAMHETIKISKEPSFEDSIVIQHPYLRKVSGCRTRIPNDDTSEWWHRIKVAGEKKDSKKDDDNNAPLKFISLTDRARAEEEIKPTQRKLIDKLIESSVKNSEWNEKNARTLFNLLIPNNFRDYTTDNKNILFILDEKSAQYPWEILHLPSAKAQKPLVTQIGFIRQLITKNSTLIDSTIENNILIVGNPKTSNNFESLPAAEEEANTVKKIFENAGFNVESSIRENGVTVVNKFLGSKNYKIIHLAGHGVLNEDPSATGMVLDNDILITPMEIDALPKTPDFVFINCCYLGKTKERDPIQFNKLAANIGTQFIRKGVKAVVAAGWAVEDNAAKYFADILYEVMLKGETFGEAVQLARLRTYDKFSTNNTWAAYQCYGDPFYRFNNKKIKNIRAKTIYVDPSEIEIEIKNLISEAEPASSRNQDILRKKLDDIISDIPEIWLDKSSIIQAIANCFYELNEFEEAIKYYKRLNSFADEISSFDSVLKLANIQTKVAVKELLNFELLSDVEKRNYANSIYESEKIIDNIIGIGTNSRRLSIKGGHFKRKCLINIPLEFCAGNSKNDVFKEGEQFTYIKECLQASLLSYQEASSFSVAEKRDYYAVLNWATLELLYKIYGSNRLKTLEKSNQMIIDITKEFQENQSNIRSFWYQIFPAAIEIYSLLNILNDDIEIEKQNQKQKQFVKNVIAIYEHNWSKGGSVRKAENTLGHIKFVIAILEKRLNFKPVPINADKIKVTIANLKELVSELTQIFSK